MLVTIIDNKLKAAGYDGVEKKKFSDMDFSEGYRQYYARMMYEEDI